MNMKDLWNIYEIFMKYLWNIYIILRLLCVMFWRIFVYGKVYYAYGKVAFVYGKLYFVYGQPKTKHSIIVFF